MLVWQAQGGEIIQRLHGHGSLVNQVAWSPNGTLLASCGGSGRQGELFVWDVQLGTRVRAFEGLFGLVTTVAWNAQGDTLVSGSTDGALRWWDFEQRGTLATV